MNCDEVLKLDDSNRETVDIPEWGGIRIVVESMTAQERADIEKRWAKKEASSDPAAFRIDVLTPCLRKWATAEQVKQLLGKNSRAVERLFEAACRVSGFAREAVEKN